MTIPRGLSSSSAGCEGGRCADAARKESTKRIQHAADSASPNRDRQDGAAANLPRSLRTAGQAQDEAVSRVTEGDEQGPDKRHGRRERPRRSLFDIHQDRDDPDEFDHDQDSCQTENEPMSRRPSANGNQARPSAERPEPRRSHGNDDRKENLTKHVPLLPG